MGKATVGRQVQVVQNGPHDARLLLLDLGGLIEAWVSHEADYGVPVEFLYEESPLGTAGALKNIESPGGTFLAMTGVVDWRQLLKFGRWFIVIAAVVAAVLTPPDVGSQMMMLVPLITLYYFSVLLAFFFGDHSLAWYVTVPFEPAPEGSRS